MITPKEKAKELLWQFLSILDGWTDNSKTDLAKQCALICVDEILNEPKMIHCGQGINDEHYKFWQEVKNEIQNYDKQN